jgi:hypothetical protein
MIVVVIERPLAGLGIVVARGVGLRRCRERQQAGRQHHVDSLHAFPFFNYLNLSDNSRKEKLTRIFRRFSAARTSGRRN